LKQYRSNDKGLISASRNCKYLRRRNHFPVTFTAEHEENAKEEVEVVFEDYSG